MLLYYAFIIQHMKKCSQCKKAAVIFRKHEGRHLCASHFIRSFEKKAKATIRKYNMIERGDSICVALSGGKDSCAVLYFLSKAFGNRPDIRIFALTIDEGIDGYRNESIEMAKTLCKRLEIEHHIVSFRDEFGLSLDEKISRERERVKEEDAWESGPCTLCGVARRYALNKHARKLGATKVATGHNLDDEVQAILMDYINGNLARASRMGGEIVKNPLFIPRIKPFRELPEKEVALYAILKDMGAQFAECPHVTGIRFLTRDFINNLEANHSGSKYSILETFNKLLPCIRKVVEKEMEEGRSALKKCRVCGEPSSQDVCKTCELWRKH